MIGKSYLIRIINAALTSLWMPSLAIAAVAVATEDDGVAAISLALAGVALLLSTLSGVTALLWRVERELRDQPDKPLLRPWLFAASHMACSWLAGALAFTLSEAQNLNEWWEVSAVIAASFAGATFVQAAAERILSKLLPGAMEQRSYRPQADYQYPSSRPQRHYGYDRRDARVPDTAATHPPEPLAGEVVDTRPGGLDELPPSGGGFIDPRAGD